MEMIFGSISPSFCNLSSGVQYPGAQSPSPILSLSSPLPSLPPHSLSFLPSPSPSIPIFGARGDTDIYLTTIHLDSPALFDLPGYFPSAHLKFPPTIWVQHFLGKLAFGCCISGGIQHVLGKIGSIILSLDKAQR